jgi:hypothetical protein
MWVSWNLWVSCVGGGFIGFMWVSCGFHVGFMGFIGFMWVSCGFHVGFIWVSCGLCGFHGFHVGFHVGFRCFMWVSWVSCGFHVGFMWVSCGFHRFHRFHVGFVCVSCGFHMWVSCGFRWYTDRVLIVEVGTQCLRHDNSLVTSAWGLWSRKCTNVNRSVSETSPRCTEDWWLYRETMGRTLIVTAIGDVGGSSCMARFV